MTNNRIIYKGDWTFPVRKDFVLNPNIKMGPKLLYIALRSFCAFEGDTAFPSSQYIADCFGINRETVIGYMKELIELKLVTREQTKQEGKFAKNIYTVYDPAAVSPHTGIVDTGNSDTKNNHCTQELPSVQVSLVEMWNSKPKLPKIRSMSSDRVAALRQRSKDPFWMENWKQAIDRVCISTFATGGGESRWKMDVEFFLRPGTVAKIMEGKYDNKPERYRSMLDGRDCRPGTMLDGGRR